MSDDDINFYVVIISFILLMLYLNYVQDMTLIKNDWENVKCNPLYLFMNSISSSNNESTKNFQTCVTKYANA
jgi:hypothetical protein